MTNTPDQAENTPVDTFLDTVTPARRAEDAHILNNVFKKVSGFQPRMWGGSIIGYGHYDYVYKSGRNGTSLATGFSPRKSALSLYIMPGYADFEPILARLGKHKTGAACVYITKLADVDIDVLAELIRAGLDDLAKQWPVQPS